MLWREIYRVLYKELHDGIFVQGEKLPTEAELSNRFEVNRHTVRRALGELQADGFIYSKRGSGTIVLSPPLTYRVGRKTRFSTHLEGSSQSSDIKILQITTRMAIDSEIEILRLNHGDYIHHVEGLRLIEERPIIYFSSRFTASIAQNLPECLFSGMSISKALAACGVEDYVRQRTRITARLASDVTARHLEINTGSPILSVKSLNTLPDATPIESGHSLMAGDKIALMVDNDEN
ncbi:MAG: phosphonate metabolism transcriptional regulator PhnF [Candidatus Puniceispirillales bacterium]